jgi:N6-L-threonylcarbamoyladenine synthase
VLSNILSSQTIHEKYGGVVPELASRTHQQNIIPVVDAAIEKAGIELAELDGVAFTKGPGLLGSLIVGVSFAKAFGLALDIPLIEVNHMQAHILAHFATPENAPPFPFLCLTVSGGHTQIVLVKNYFDMEILGRTIDDAAGEAFDKAGKMLSLPYPAGPAIDMLAKKGKHQFNFPIPSVPNLDFSFSGLKTSILYFLQDAVKNNPHFIQENLEDLCHSIQKTITEILIRKMDKAISLTGVTHIALAGGVSANSELREAFQKLAISKGGEAFIPPFEYCTDNAAMIGIAGYYKYLMGIYCHQDISPDPRFTFESYS